MCSKLKHKCHEALWMCGCLGDFSVFHQCLSAVLCNAAFSAGSMNVCSTKNPSNLLSIQRSVLKNGMQMKQHCHKLLSYLDLTASTQVFGHYRSVDSLKQQVKSSHKVRLSLYRSKHWSHIKRILAFNNVLSVQASTCKMTRMNTHYVSPSVWLLPDNF